MKLRKLLKNSRNKVFVKGSQEIEITGISNDSRYVAPGNLFIVKRGKKYDANKFVPDAIAAGAMAIVTDLYDPFLNKITQIICSDPALIEAEIANQYFEYPSKELFTVGITGTNGKTTSAYLIKHVLDGLEKKCGLIGTIEYILGANRIFSTLTTPDLVSNLKYFREMIKNGCRAAVMETSSHGLEQNRLKNIEFNVGIFTNLTLDHLDFHMTMENYFLAKKKLFSQLKKENSYAILNIDDPYGKRLKNEIRATTFTISLNQKADLYADNIQFDVNGINFDLHYQDQKERFFSPLVGKFNVYNLLSAIAVGIIQNASLSSMKEIIASFEKVQGRLERVENLKGMHIFVDHAHTEDALKNVLEAIKVFSKGKIVTVFGCGGDRDHSKRPKMAGVAEKYSDFTIVTTDNPRSEDPKTIIQEIVQGFKNNQYAIVENRKEAIQKAVQMATNNDIILIAGKGHETYQIIGNKTVPFDDRKIAKEICNASK